MPKIIISTLLVLLACSGLSMANECKPPRIKQGEITYKIPPQNTSPVVFSRHRININNPTLTIFSTDILIYIYGEGENRKTLSIQALPDTLKDSNNKYNATEAYKLAFGLDNKEASDEFILNIRSSLQICDAEITQYPFKGINTPIIKVNMIISGKKDTIFYVFNNIEPFIDMVQFSNFTDKEIDQVMSTFQPTNNKRS